MWKCPLRPSTSTKELHQVLRGLVLPLARVLWGVVEGQQTLSYIYWGLPWASSSPVSDHCLYCDSNKSKCNLEQMSDSYHWGRRCVADIYRALILLITYGAFYQIETASSWRPFFSCQLFLHASFCCINFYWLCYLLSTDCGQREWIAWALAHFLASL